MRVNLIPARRRDARQRQRRIRLWAAGAALCALGLMGVYVACQGRWAHDARALEADLAAAARQIEQNEQSATALRPKLAEAVATLEVGRAVSKQPDWSILLGLLGQTLGEEIVLDSGALAALETAAAGGGGTNAAARPAPTAAPEQERVMLRVSGFGRSQAAVAQFVLRLEQTGLFEQVTLQKAKTEPFLGGDATAFKLDCLLKGHRRAAR